MLAEMTGDFKMFLPGAPEGFKIKQILPRGQDGFILIDDAGHFKIYQMTSDPRKPYEWLRDMPTGIEEFDEPWHKQIKKMEHLLHILRDG